MRRHSAFVVACPPESNALVELRLGETSRRLAQDLVGPLQLANLAFEFLETITFRTRHAGTLSLVALRLPYPFTQGLPCAADLTRNRDDRRPLRLVLPLALKHHPDGPFTELRRILRCCFHDSILSSIGVSGNPGAVQNVLAHLCNKHCDSVSPQFDSGAEPSLPRGSSSPVPLYDEGSCPTMTNTRAVCLLT